MLTEVTTLYKTHTLELRPLRRRVRTIAGCSGVATICASFDFALETLEHRAVHCRADSNQLALPTHLGQAIVQGTAVFWGWSCPRGGGAFSCMMDMHRTGETSANVRSLTDAPRSCR